MNTKRLFIISSIILLIVSTVLAVYTLSYRNKIGSIYLYNMESLVRSLDSVDKTIAKNGTITDEEYSITYLKNAVLTDQYPSPLGIDFYITEINNMVNNQEDISKIHSNIILLKDSIHVLIYEQCHQNADLIFALQDRNNSATKGFITKTLPIIEKATSQ